jgi:hypothetical protein
MKRDLGSVRVLTVGVVSVLGVLGWSLTGCMVSTSSANAADRPSVAIASLSITPTTVNDGETFEVVWDVAHSSNSGEVLEIGLYAGTAASLVTAAQRDASVFFSVATTPGSGLTDISRSSSTCTRTGSAVMCTPASGRGRTVGTEALETTFRACNSYVLDTTDVCDTRAVTMTFP